MKILIAYFSYMVNTKGIAAQIQEQTGGTLFEITPAAPYSTDYDTTERQGRRETREGYRPAGIPSCTGRAGSRSGRKEDCRLAKKEWFGAVKEHLNMYEKRGECL